MPKASVNKKNLSVTFIDIYNEAMLADITHPAEVLGCKIQKLAESTKVIVTCDSRLQLAEFIEAYDTDSKSLPKEKIRAFAESIVNKAAVVKEVKVKVPSKADKIRAMVAADPEITIVGIIKALEAQNIPCRRSEVISAVNKAAAVEEVVEEATK